MDEATVSTALKARSGQKIVVGAKEWAVVDTTGVEPPRYCWFKDTAVNLRRILGERRWRVERLTPESRSHRNTAPEP